MTRYASAQEAAAAAAEAAQIIRRNNAENAKQADRLDNAKREIARFLEVEPERCFEPPADPPPPEPLRPIGLFVVNEDAVSVYRTEIGLGGGLNGSGEGDAAP